MLALYFYTVAPLFVNVTLISFATLGSTALKPRSIQCRSAVVRRASQRENNKSCCCTSREVGPAGGAMSAYLVFEQHKGYAAPPDRDRIDQEIQLVCLAGDKGGRRGGCAGLAPDDVRRHAGYEGGLKAQIW